MLTSICYLAEKMLKCEEINTNIRELEDKIGKMQSCEFIIPYLGMAKYSELLKNAQKYSN